MRLAVLLFALPAMCVVAEAQNPYSRANTYTVFGEYSNDSSHIILGVTPDRKLAGVGVQYERRLLSARKLRVMELGYAAEFRPFIVSSDPVATVTFSEPGIVTTGGPYTSSIEVSKCVAGTYTYTVSSPTGNQTYKEQVSCSRQNTLAQGGSPIGLRLHFLPARKLQLMLSANGGYMYSTKPIPIPSAGSFNFTFNFGGGLEYYVSEKRSWRLEYLVQHYSNYYTAESNPGVDSGFVRLAYSFGR